MNVRRLIVAGSLAVAVRGVPNRLRAPARCRRRRPAGAPGAAPQRSRFRPSLPASGLLDPAQRRRTDARGASKGPRLLQPEPRPHPRAWIRCCSRTPATSSRTRNSSSSSASTPRWLATPATTFATTGRTTTRRPTGIRRCCRMWGDFFAGWAVFVVFCVVTGVLVWLVKTLVDYRRWYRLSKVQTEAHNKLLDRFAANEELLAYIGTPSGKRFLESAPIMLDGAASISRPAEAYPVGRRDRRGAGVRAWAGSSSPGTTCRPKSRSRCSSPASSPWRSAWASSWRPSPRSSSRSGWGSCTRGSRNGRGPMLRQPRDPEDPTVARDLVVAGVGRVDEDALATDEPLSMDEDAFRAFYDLTSRAVWAYLSHVTGDPHAADDLLQETYIRFLGVRRRWESDAHRRNFLFRVATNLAHDRHRRNRPRAGPTRSRTARAGGRGPSGATASDARRGRRVAHRPSSRPGTAVGARARAAVARLRGRVVTPGDCGRARASAGGIRVLLFRARRKLAALLRGSGPGRDAMRGECPRSADVAAAVAGGERFLDGDSRAAPARGRVPGVRRPGAGDVVAARRAGSARADRAGSVGRPRLVARTVAAATGGGARGRGARDDPARAHAGGSSLGRSSAFWRGRSPARVGDAGDRRPPDAARAGPTAAALPGRGCPVAGTLRP